MASVAKFFKDFEEPLSTLFQLDSDTQEGVIKLFNDRGPYLGIYEFAKARGLTQATKQKISSKP